MVRCLVAVGTDALFRKGGVAGLQPPQSEIKKTDFCRHNAIRLLRDLAFSLGQPLKSAGDWHSGILQNAVKPTNMVIIFKLVEISL